MIPLELLIVLYLVNDPYKLIYHHDYYLSDIVLLNRGYTSTRIYIQNREKYRYNSFILGSSRSSSFTSTEWGKYLAENDSPFSFGSWNESIEGILGKIKLISDNSDSIKNALIIVDTDMTFRDAFSVSLAYDHYLISGISRAQFHLNYFMDFIKTPRLVLAAVDYKIFRRKRSYMKNFIGLSLTDIDTINNDWMVNSENEIISDSTRYYSDPYKLFYTRNKSPLEAEVQINEAEKYCLQQIKDILSINNTDFKIVISPLYDQVKINSEDLKLLSSIFGKENVFDFSGKNYFTDNINNYHNDAFHYRKKVGNEIYTIIYKN